MSYIVLARKYRPATFDEFVGQDAISKTLKNAVETGRVAHAYLFAGERGVGKTSMARVLAKALNCAAGAAGVPCNECDMCRRIAVGEDVDVIEIDGASHRTVEEISEVLRNVSYRPVRARYKLYIIDEVHMLSVHAFNALLKTLEEPPEHVKFIFATTEPNKVLPTIRSRCQRFDFRRISVKEITDRLAFICREEKVEAEEGTLLLIARSARGGMRDAQSILDQLMSISPGQISMDNARMLLGLPPEEKIFDLVDVIQKVKVAEALQMLDEMLLSGTDALDLVNLLTEHFRDLLVLRTTSAGSDIARQAGEEVERKRSQSSRVTRDTLMCGIQTILDARQKIREGLDPRIVLEMAVVKLCSMEDLLPLGEIAKRLDELASGGGPGAARRANMRGGGGTGYEPRRQEASTREQDVDQGGTSTQAELPQDGVSAPDGSPEGKWNRVLAMIERESRGSVANFLRLAEASFPAEDTVEVKLSGPQREYIERRKAILEKHVKKVFGPQVRIRTVAAKADAEAKAASTPQDRRADEHRRIYKDPFVSRVIDIFEGRVVRVEDK